MGFLNNPIFALQTTISMKKILFAISLIAFAGATNAQWSITSLGETGDTITFDVTMAGVNNGTFNGTGFESAPLSGQLDSDAWKFTGLSDGDSYFGGDFNSGDYAKGTSGGGEFGGGIYAFGVAPGDTAVGVQPTGSDWTPGEFILRVINNTGVDVDSVYLGYDLIINNNEARGNSFDFGYSVNDSTSFATIISDTSVEVSQGSVLWVTYSRYAALPIAMQDGDTLYLAWSGDDVNGSGSRDEFALDNISVIMVADTGSGGSSFSYYDIPTLTTVDANGVADSLGVECVTSGIVVGVDMDGNAGYSFTLWNQEGINVFSFADVDGYVVEEGDSIVMRGVVDQFNGLIQFIPDTISLLDSGLAIPTPTLITSLGEVHESELVRIENFWVDAIAGANITLSDGSNNIVIRIDSDTDIPNNVDFAVGDTLCYLIGIGGQFDPTNPYTEGYQLFPQRSSDIDNSCGSIPPPPVFFYPIPEINNVDANGEPDSLGVYCWTSGVVLGVDLDGNAGLSFTLWDEEGINVFNFIDVSNYVVTEGDSLYVRGTIAFYNGLTEILVDSVEVVNSGNPIPSPMTVTSLTEEMESMPIRLINVTVLNPSQWPTSFSSNVDLVTCSGDTIVMRIDSDTDVEDSISMAPTGMFTVTGIGGQFDNSSPYSSGYQIFPMSFTDIDSTTDHSVPSLIVNEIMSDNVASNMDAAGDYDDWAEIKNAGTTTVSLAGMFFTNDAAEPTKYMVPTTSTATIAAGGYSLVWCDNESAEGDLHTTFELAAAGGYFGMTSTDGCALVSALTFPAMGANESYGYYPEGTDTLVIFQYFSTTPGAMNMLDTINSVGSVNGQGDLVVYPNPSVGAQLVRFNQTISYTLYDVLGNIITVARNTNELNVATLASGNYILRTSEGETLRIIRQ
jgi:hypothetical protein